MSEARLPNLGFGLGLRVEHYESLLSDGRGVDWLEVLSENYLVPGGRPLRYLARFRERWPLVMHGVSLSIGSSDPLRLDYLRELKQLADFIQPQWISDHLCWTGIDDANLFDLMPLPYTEEAIDHVAARVRAVQDTLGRRILLENVSSYISYHASQLSEWDFLSEVAERADCLILLDVNNVYVSSRNHGFDPRRYLRGLPAARIQQIHLAGHSYDGQLIIDTHDHPVAEPVWELYAESVRLFGPVSTMIERDDRIPPLAELMQELERARAISHDVLRLAA